jgi:hypothetical protein
VRILEWLRTTSRRMKGLINAADLGLASLRGSARRP